MTNESNPEVLSSDQDPNIDRQVGQTDQLTGVEMSRIVERLGSLSLSEDTVLAEHQIEAFDDIVTFFREGGRECYAKIPTGGGKTVLYVEIAKRLVELESVFGEESRVMVCVPTVDLVGQAIGSVDPATGKRKGFKGFAPDLDVRPLHGKVAHKDRIKNLVEANVLVTTYDSFRNLTSSLDAAESKTLEGWDEELLDCAQKLEAAEATGNRLIIERRQFIKDAYEDQEVTRFVIKAGELLKAKDAGELELTKAEEKDLKSVLKLMNTERSSKEFRLRKVRPIIRRMISPKIKSSLEAMSQVDQIARQKRKETEERKKLGLPRLSEPVIYDEEAEIDRTYKTLNEYEAFVVETVRRNSASRTPKTDDLMRRSDRERVYSFNDSIAYQRQRANDHKQRIRAIEYFKVLREAGAQFDLIICDEAHRSIGTETWDAIRAYAARKEIALLGLTATDKYYDRSLEDFFEKKVHELTKQEAMRRKIVNPVAMFVHDTGLRFSNVGLDASGEYDRTTIREMRFNEERNMIGVNYAAQLTEAGYSGIMSAIPGDEGAHARELAELLNKQQIVDPKTGELRNLRAQFILDDTQDRQMYYDQFEAGDIDWLTFVDVIREGWDSDRAKALINMRPTRSPLLATQRLGRIGRIYPGAPVSIVIDLFDGIERLSNEEIAIKEIPPALGVDVFEVNNVEQGFIVGPHPDETPALIATLNEQMPLKVMKAHHNDYTELLQKLQVIDGRGIAIGSNGELLGATTWQTFEAVQKAYKGFLPKEVIMEATMTDPPAVHAAIGRRGDRVVPIFNMHDIQKLVDDQSRPIINIMKLYIDADGERWITPEGCTQFLSKRFPHLRPETIVDNVRKYEEYSGHKIDKSIARVQISFSEDNSRYGLTHMYKLEEIKDRLVPYLLEVESQGSR